MSSSETNNKLMKSNMNTIDLSQPISTVMTSQLITSFPDMIMTEVADIFDKNEFHHLPVLDETDKCLGIISKSDYLQLQDKFTKLQIGYFKSENKKFFGSLISSEVMRQDPICIFEDDTIGEALSIFLANRIRAIIVLNQKERCVGIVTPFDLLKMMARLSKQEMATS